MKIRKIFKEQNYEKLWKKMGKKSDGFTFIETLAVLAIGAILSGGCLFSAGKIMDTAKRSAAKSQISQYSAALQIYFIDCGRFPTTEQGISALWEKPVLYPVPEEWNGPYVESIPQKDPWGTAYKYLSSESSLLPADVPKNLPFVIISYGKDKTEGGKEDDSDIYSWK